MKHLKKFNENKIGDNDIKDIINEINDIFLEEIDLGYYIRFDNPNSKYYLSDNLIGIKKEIGDVDIYISKLKKKNDNNGNFFISFPFSVYDISESLDRICHYMENLNYNSIIGGQYYEGESFELNLDSINQIKYLHIKFRKNK